VRRGLPGEVGVTDLRTLDDCQRALDARGPSIAKAGPLPHSAEDKQAHERFTKCVAELRRHGWSDDRIARKLGIARTTFISVFRGHHYVAARWLDTLDAMPELDALPTKLRVQQLQRAV
jgi:hypothetical protein